MVEDALPTIVATDLRDVDEVKTADSFFRRALRYSLLSSLSNN
jgi:hypothetical protein